MIRAVLFDLDDTLYPEGDYFRSGFAVVAQELAARGFGNSVSNRALLESIHFNEGRDGVFDKAAARLRFPATYVAELVEMLHRHQPQIELPAETVAVLADLRRRYRLGIVTNGHAPIQRRKLAALAVGRLVDAVMVSDDLGRQHWKPDPLPFWTCCDRLVVDPEEAVVVGDHPECDILGAKKAGMPAIRIARHDGYFRTAPDLPDASPQGRITRLAELAAAIADMTSPAIAAKGRRLAA